MTMATPNGDPRCIAYCIATAEARERKRAAIEQAEREWAVNYYAPGWRAARRTNKRGLAAAMAAIDAEYAAAIAPYLPMLTEETKP